MALRIVAMMFSKILTRQNRIKASLYPMSEYRKIQANKMRRDELSPGNAIKYLEKDVCYSHFVFTNYKQAIKIWDQTIKNLLT